MPSVVSTESAAARNRTVSIRRSFQWRIALCDKRGLTRPGVIAPGGVRSDKDMLT